ncbi:MAG: 30S ribosomal protein S4 [bacterium]
MAKMLPAKCVKCRREKEKLFLKGDRCFTAKCAMVKKPYAPGMHGKQMSRNSSEFGKQLREKQKVKKIYSVLEKQFKNYYKEASRKKGVTGEMMLKSLERRLDNVIFRIGVAKSRAAARQIVNHGHIQVEKNGVKRTVNIPSFGVKSGDKIYLKESSLKKGIFKNLDLKKVQLPSWISLNPTEKVAQIVSEPSMEDINVNADMQLIVEHYAR